MSENMMHLIFKVKGYPSNIPPDIVIYYNGTINTDYFINKSLPFLLKPFWIFSELSGSRYPPARLYHPLPV
jgi:hypothetical protein